MLTGRPRTPLAVTPDERQHAAGQHLDDRPGRPLEWLTHRSRSAPLVARRARIILACADGRPTMTWPRACMCRPRRCASGARGLRATDSTDCTMNRATALEHPSS